MTAPSGRWRLGFGLALLTAVLWGAVPLAMTPLLSSLDPVTVSWFRYAGAGGVLCLLFVRNLFGVAAALAITGALLFAGVKFSEYWRDTLLKVLALQLILDGYNSLFTVLHLSRTSDTATDAQAMAQLTWLPATF